MRKSVSATSLFVFNSLLLLSLLLLSAMTGAAVAERYESGVVYSVHLDSARDTYSVHEGKGGLAFGSVSREAMENGWNIFEGSTHLEGHPEDEKLAFGLGYLEGALTQKSIYQSWFIYLNTTQSLLNPIPHDISQFVQQNMEWMGQQVSAHGSSSKYWRNIGLLLQQKDGMFKAYNDHASPEERLTEIQWLMYFLNLEVADYQAKFGMAVPSSEHVGQHCSVMIKLSERNGELFSGHVTWTSYWQLLRMYKHYHTSFHHEDAHGYDISFSGYPGLPVSGDDFSVTNANLMITETTNEVFNTTLYSAVTYQTVPYWLRSQIANRLASTAEEWTSLFSAYNSGTYNNQWMVVDYKKFTPGKPLEPNTFRILEQLPGFIATDDMSEYLQKHGKWVSYNIPYFPRVYELSGYEEMKKKQGNMWSWSECARAKIFRRDGDAVETLEDMKKMMRFNQWQTDPLSLHDACRGISARCDLNAPWATGVLNQYSDGPFGSIDGKITSSVLMKERQVVAQSGPSTDSQPPFKWSEQWDMYPHPGMPSVFDFDWVTMNPIEKVEKSEL